MCVVHNVYWRVQEQKLQSLQARVGEGEKAMAELEDTASRQMHGLAQKSTKALESAQSKLNLADAQLQQLHTFIQVPVQSSHSTGPLGDPVANYHLGSHVQMLHTHKNAAYTIAHAHGRIYQE